MGITHFDEAPSLPIRAGHLQARWTALGDAAGSVGVGLRRIEVEAGGWSTPAHEHGAEEEIFYVLGGRGVSWQKGATTEIGPGDCIAYLPGRGAHSVHAFEELDVLAFGTRVNDESPGFPRLGLSLIGRRAAETVPRAVDRLPIQFAREAALGPPELPAPGPRPSNVVNVADVEAETLERPRVARTRRNLGAAAGSVATGLKWVQVSAGMDAAPPHIHSAEEEIFVVLDGDGVVVLGEEETPVRRGHVVARPPGTGVAHQFRGGEKGLTFLAYGTREPSDVCYYPRSNKIYFRGVNLVARLERLEYWDGED